MEKEGNPIRKYLFWIVILILLIASYFIIKSYIVALISAFILAYLTKPLYDSLSKRIGKRLSAVICLLVVIIILLVPIALITGTLVQQAYSAWDSHTLSRESLQQVASYLPLESLGIDLETIKEKGIQIFISIISSTLSNLPSILISLIIILLGMYYILINWDSLRHQLKSYLPFKEKDQVSKEIANSTNHIVYGYVLIAIIEFLIALLGFYLSGVDSFLLLAALLAILAFIPGLGPGLVWLPLTLYNFIFGNPGTGIGVLVTGLVISIGIETLLFGKILGRKSNIHPLILLIGVFGGVPLFGLFGFVIGPLILVYTLKLLQQGLHEHPLS